MHRTHGRTTTNQPWPETCGLHAQTHARWQYAKEDWGSNIAIPTHNEHILRNLLYSVAALLCVLVGMQGAWCAVVQQAVHTVGCGGLTAHAQPAG